LRPLEKRIFLDLYDFVALETEVDQLQFR